jgi:PAS domain S-box-containing protein
MARIQKAELDEIDRQAITHMNVMRFGRNDGLSSGSTAGNGVPAAQLLTDGRVITVTDKGIAVIDPKSLQTNNQPPTVAIEQVIVDERPIPPGSALSIPAGANRLEIRYTALSLVAPQRLRFRYQLVGSDPNWVEAGHERSARYTHLNPGHYTFRVLACNNDGVWNNVGAQVAFTIEPRIYQTLWFRLAALVGLAVAIAALWRLRMRQLNQRQQALARTNAELDQRVKDRTAEVSRSHAELQQRETLFRLIFEHAPVGICWKRADLGATHHFNSTCRRILDLPADELSADAPLAALVHPEDAPRQAEMEQRIRSGQADSYTIEQRFVCRDGREVWALFAAAVIRDADGKILQTIGILEDVTARKRAEQELTDTYKRLMEASRMAGMAEVATGVLHNVGNVLNSVNVSATLISEGLNQSRVGSVAKMSALLHQNSGNLAAFLTEDPKGQRILPFLDTLADQLAGERQRLIAEARSLRDNVEHIKEIVARQQSFAHLGGLLEKLSPSELMDDTLRMTSVSLKHHGIVVAREFSSTPLVMAERHKVLQILINLVQNAEHALTASTRTEKRLCLRIVHDETRVCFIVSDNGVGITAENLAKIFQHGFTTRKDGHGFGLHSAALSAKEMKGRLSVLSDGQGCGATFHLELPAAVGELTPTSLSLAAPASA